MVLVESPELLALLLLLLRTSHRRNVPLPAVILHKMGSDVGWNFAAIMGGGGGCVVLELLLVVLLVLTPPPPPVIVWILPISLFVLVVDDDDDTSIDDDAFGFQNRIIASEQPTANNEPDAFQSTLLA